MKGVRGLHFIGTEVRATYPKVRRAIFKRTEDVYRRI